MKQEPQLHQELPLFFIGFSYPAARISGPVLRMNYDPTRAECSWNKRERKITMQDLIGRPLDSFTPHPTFMEALRFWLKLGFISFGGPAGQIAIMQQRARRQKAMDQRASAFSTPSTTACSCRDRRHSSWPIYIGWLLHGRARVASSPDRFLRDPLHVHPFRPQLCLCDLLKAQFL